MTIFDKLLDPQQDNIPNQSNPNQKQNYFFFCLNAKQYFDIEEQDIFDRAKSAILLKPPFRTVVLNKPDLYGPFWIATTLIIIIIASSSLITLFSQQNDSYDFDQISVAAGLVYGISFGCPYIIALVIKIMGSTLSVVDLICIYGYSLTIFLPITMLCFINSDMIQMMLLGVAYFFSAVFLIRGILSMDRNLGQKQKMVLGVFILGVQFVLVIMYKFYFFKLI